LQSQDLEESFIFFFVIAFWLLFAVSSHDFTIKQQGLHHL